MSVLRRALPEHRERALEQFAEIVAVGTIKTSSRHTLVHFEAAKSHLRRIN